MDIFGLARHGLNNFEQIGILAVLIVAFISLLYAWLLRGIVFKKEVTFIIETSIFSNLVLHFLLYF